MELVAWRHHGHSGSSDEKVILLIVINALFEYGCMAALPYPQGGVAVLGGLACCVSFARESSGTASFLLISRALSVDSLAHQGWGLIFQQQYSLIFFLECLFVLC